LTIETLQFKDVITQLVSQQFFIKPNIITDRTYSIQFEITGSEIILDYFVNLLYENSSDLFGEEPSPYLSALMRSGKKLAINPLEKLEKRFNEKIGSFIDEGLATETILFIATISSILEVLDYSHYQMLLKELSALYYHQCISRYSTDEYEEQSKKLSEGIKRLSEAASSKLSLLQNIIKIKNLASIFDLSEHLSYDKRQVQNYQSEVIQKIINESY
jgi:hypothetical protein